MSQDESRTAAILAERERCAGIADEWSRRNAELADSAMTERERLRAGAWAEGFADIAAAIRKGEPGSGRVERADD